MAKENYVGNQQIIFTFDAHGERAENLVISAHGGYWAMPKKIGWKPVPAWTTLHFFGPHKSSIYDPGFKDVIRGDVKVHETLQPGDMCRNYKLNKYQGRHGEEKETYAAIKAALDDQVEKELPFASRTSNPLSTEICDFLTIRCRTLRISPSLFDVLKVLDQKGWRYANIYSSFCRSRMIGPDTPYQPQRPFRS
ncbi:MAG TPA: hypothetical protein VM223_19610 [Planctomycetota bacterium]|nr:hypothetical protein [Planctomycetota bacterium]